MTGSASMRWTFWVSAIACVKGAYAKILSESRLADDGKRIYAMDVFSSCESLLIG